MYYTLITGASKGIGRDLAYIFAKNHRPLILIARDQKKLEEIKKDIESKFIVRVSILPFDLSLPDSIDKIFEIIKNENWKIQNLINNAGFANNGFFLTNSLEKEIEQIQVNIVSVVKFTYLIVNEMLKDSQEKNKYFYKVLNVASTAAFQPGPYMSIYYATKSFVFNFSEALYEELKNKNILVSTLCPGPTQTEFFRSANMENTRLFQSPLIMKSQKVAEYGYKELMKNKSIIIPGVINKIGVFSTRLFPRNLIRKITGYLNRSNL